jgi:hypothetical protein
LHPDGTITPVHELDTGIGEYVNINITQPAEWGDRDADWIMIEYGYF